MSELRIHRRYCLMKRVVATRSGEYANAQMWQNKQEEQAGTVLPANFPHRSALAEAGYTTKEDIIGADDVELNDVAGLTLNAGAAVIAAAEAL
jgi:hypothetical protein